MPFGARADTGDAGDRLPVVEFRVQVTSLVFGRFGFPDRDSVCVRPSVLADAGDLQADLLPGGVARDRGLAAAHLRGDMQVRGRPADRGELVAPVLVECPEPDRQAHYGAAVPVQHDRPEVPVTPVPSGEDS